MPNEQSPVSLETPVNVSRPARRLARRVVLLVLIPLAVVAVAVGYWLHGARYVSTENAYVKTDIAKMAAEVSGRAIEVRAHEHMKVKKGEILVRIDPEPFRIAVARAQADLNAMRRQVETSMATLQEARTELQDAHNRATYFHKRFARESKLVKSGVSSQSRFDDMENDAAAADDHISMVREKIARIETSLGGDPDTPVDDHPMVEEKIAALAQAKLDLDRTVVRAPCDGTVVTMPLVVGDQIKASEPLFAIVTDTPPWVDANFKETDLTHVRVGQKAKVVLDTYPDITWDAVVQSISPATGAEFAILPPQNASGNWVKVVQRLPVRLQLMPKSDAPPLRAGMTATVTIDTEHQRHLADLFGSFAPVAEADTESR